MAKSIKSSKPPKQLKKSKKSKKSRKIVTQNPTPSNNSFLESMTSGFGLGIGMESAKTAFSSIFSNSDQPVNSPQPVNSSQTIIGPKLCDAESSLLLECVKNPESSTDCYDLFQNLQNCYTNNKKI